MAKAYYDICPCKGCDKRVVGCHAKCVNYNEWLKSGIEIPKPFYNKPKKKKEKK